MIKFLNSIGSWLSLAGCMTASAFAQPPDTLWTRLHDIGENSGDTGTTRLAPALDGGFVVTVEGPTGDFSGGLLKLSAGGDELWQRWYNYSDWNGAGFYFTALHAQSDGGFAVYGNICSFCLWGSGMGMIRTDANGDSLWSRQYFYFSNFGGLGHTNSSIWDAEPTLDGGRVIAGQIFIVVGQNQYVNYAVVMKVTAAGDTVWVSRHDSVSHFTDVDVLSSGGFIAVGAGPRVSVEHPHDLLIARLAENGSTEWSLSPGTGRAVANSVEETPDGGFIVAGYVEELNGAQNVRLLKLDSSGNIVWTRSDVDTNLAAVYRLRRVSSGGYISLAPDFGLIRFDENGDTVWTHTYTPPENHYGSFGDVVETTDHGYKAVGTTYEIGPQNTYIYLVRTLPDTTTIEAAPEPSGPMPFEIMLSVFPNPFNPSTTISFSLPRTSDVTLAVYDVTGRKVKTLMDQSMNAGEYSISFDGFALPSGLYFARLTAGDFSRTQKMVLLK